MLVSDFDFYLPEELIAQEALPERSASRMLHVARATGRFRDRRFADLPRLEFPRELLRRLKNLSIGPACRAVPTLVNVGTLATETLEMFLGSSVGS